VIATVRAVLAGLLADRRVRTILGLAAVGIGTSALRTVEREYAQTLTDLETLIAERMDRLAELKVELGRTMNATCEAGIGEQAGEKHVGLVDLDALAASVNQADVDQGAEGAPA
jgi:hypothetical protein